MTNQTMKARKGATFIEYAMLAGLVAIVVAIAAAFFGKEIKGLFTETGKQTSGVTEKVRAAKIQADTAEVK